MTDIQIPPEALEAGARAAMLAIVHEVEPDARANDLTPEEYACIARAAFLAMLRNWPGMMKHTWVDKPVSEIILPLTQETHSVNHNP